MTLNFMKSAGIGFFSIGLTIAVLLFFPFKQGEIWSRWALLVVSLVEFGLIVMRMLDVRAHTPARPPLLPFVVLLVIAIICFWLSFVGKGTQTGKIHPIKEEK